MLKPQVKDGVKLRSTMTGVEFPFETLEEFTVTSESLEVVVPAIASARVREGLYLWERFADFLPFAGMDSSSSLGEGNTPLLPASAALQQFTGLPGLLLKDETQNPTWSFKDRGSLTCIFMARALGETRTATISTGNMGNSIAAYATRSDLQAVVFIPSITPQQKVEAMSIHGATVLRVSAPDYTQMKSTILGLAREFRLRIVTGNGPVRVEGYKLEAFEMFEQLGRTVPDYIAVPTSACGHLRGIWKGWRELQIAGFTSRLPRMIVVQAENNCPLVSAMRVGSSQVMPFSNFHTIAEAITSGDPLGGNEILNKAYAYNWLGETATEDEILDGQRLLARAGHFVEPASATSLYAVKKLRANGRIAQDATVVIMLTGSGLKDLSVMPMHACSVTETPLGNIRDCLDSVLRN